MRPQPSVSLPAAAAGGLAAGAAALGAGELVGGVRSAWQSPVVAVAEAVIDRVPRAVKDFAIETFGKDDKVALVVGILAVSVVFAAVLGVVARRRVRLAGSGFAAFAAVGVWASQQAVSAPLTAIVPSIAAGLAGVGSLWYLFGRAAPEPAVAGVPLSDGQPAPADDPLSDVQPTMAGLAGTGSRRSFLLASAGLAVGAAALAGGGRALRTRFSAAASRAAVRLPIARNRLPPAAVATGDPGVSPFFTPNDRFYRVDTALTVPQVRAEGWQLRIHGLVDRELRLSFDDLLARDVVEDDITLTCVSNTVGGDLLGTARWLGVPLGGLLAEAGVQAGATQVVGRSVDGYTCGFPLESLDGRPALVAFGMNGDPLPLQHGFPARLSVSGLYGYVSATKWLTEIELTTFDAFDQYWVRRGWDERAPIKTMARIDTPRTLATLEPGTNVIGGVAWAQTRGISKVEVAIDGDDFAVAQLADELNTHTWRQWSFPWNATPGRHRITVRATDGTGSLQTDQRAEPFPNGASGWMSIFVDVLPNPSTNQRTAP
ncbi:MAG: molybdopterin-dependent oxidoreductase [Acidimicrobiia bacterium]